MVKGTAGHLFRYRELSPTKMTILLINENIKQIDMYSEPLLSGSIKYFGSPIAATRDKVL